MMSSTLTKVGIGPRWCQVIGMASDDEGWCGGGKEALRGTDRGIEDDGHFEKFIKIN